MSDEQWERCEEMAKWMHLRSSNEFIRDAVDFYIEWCRRPYSQQFLTAALESVISAKIRESESRICRMLFKNAVEQNVSTRLAAWDYDLSDKLRVSYQIAGEMICPDAISTVGAWACPS